MCFCLWRCPRLSLFLLWRWHVGPRYLQTVTEEVQQAVVALRWVLVHAWALISVFFASSVDRLSVQCSVHLNDIAPPLCRCTRGRATRESSWRFVCTYFFHPSLCGFGFLGVGVGAKAIMPVIAVIYPETRETKLFFLFLSDWRQTGPLLKHPWSPAGGMIQPPELLLDEATTEGCPVGSQSSGRPTWPS